ncbi:MAG: asparagine synthase (glutamine-hydrolyzing) [Bryobacteraceae bacterium]
MCGIAGFTHKKRAVDPHVIRRIAGSLEHRGPDQHGVYEAADISMAAVRLKIIDLGGGDQPILSADRDTVVVFNGEIYNHAELRSELEGLGARFRTRCDTEVVLEAFRHWDTGCFSRLRGMFGIALWTESRKRLVLARDRLGIKPLYIHRRESDIYFGSELKALFEHVEVPRQLDLTGLHYYLSLNYVPCPYTLAAGIEKLPPGYLLEWCDGRVQSEPYWQVRFQPRARSVEDASEELDGLLKSSIREHMISDVPLGVWSSGGLDSSTVLHYAAQESSRPLKTFSVGFPGRSFDETRYFREMAERFGTDHHEFEMDANAELAGAIEEFGYYSDEPSADAGALPVWYLSRMSRQQVTVALSGDGGDEVFGGYLTYRADEWSRRLQFVPGFVRRMGLAAAHLLLPVSDDKIGFEYKVKRMLEGSLLPPDEAHFFWNGSCSSAQKGAICPSLRGPSLETLIESLPAPGLVGYLNRYILADHHYYLPDDILCKVDRMSMAHSLEVRPPLLDHRIVEFAASLPEHLKIRGSEQKVLLKHLMKDKLPASILNRKKCGFDVPAHDWFRGVLRPLLLDTLGGCAARSSALFDFAAINSLVRDHTERRVNVGYQLWGLLTLFLWMNRWGIQVAPQEQVRPASHPVFTAKSS